MGKQSKGVSAERELKRIFLGLEDMSDRPQFTENERLGYRTTIEHPFLSVRSAASLQVDLLVCKQNIILPFEIKASSKKEFHFSSSDMVRAQLEGYIAISKNYGLLPLYAFRLSNTTRDPWRIFLCPISRSYISSEMLEIYDRVPEIGRNSLGNYQMSWDDGLELHKFLLLLHQLTVREHNIQTTRDHLWSFVRAIQLCLEEQRKKIQQTGSWMGFIRFSNIFLHDPIVSEIQELFERSSTTKIHCMFGSEFFLESKFYFYQTVLPMNIVALLDSEARLTQAADVTILSQQAARVVASYDKLGVPSYLLEYDTD